MLPLVVQLLFERHADDKYWDLSGVLLALPGAQAARRLRRLLHDMAARQDLVLAEPKLVTPAQLFEALHTPTARIATRMQSRFAWMAAAAKLADTDSPAHPTAWADLASDAQRARDTVVAERLTLAQAAALPGACDDTRWQALARLEPAYLAALAEAGLCDRDDARMAALDNGQVTCRSLIYLVGLQDLNGLERAMLRALKSPVVAVIPAPKEEHEKFDAVGTLCPEAWQDTPIDIPSHLLRFVEGPAEEAAALVEQMAALDGAFAPEEITVGIGDQAAAEGLARRLAVLGVPSFSPFGRPLSRTRPAALLGALRDYLQTPTAAAFAALVRHPDIELFLTGTSAPSLPLLIHLDTYRAECLPVMLPQEDGNDPAVAASARAHAAAAVRLLEQTLLGPLQTPPQPLHRWAEPITDLLRHVYAEEQPEEPHLTRSLAGLGKILHGFQNLPPALSPTVSGTDALAAVLRQAQTEHLPSEPASGSGIELMGWLELALDDAPVLLLTGLQEGNVPENLGGDSLLPDSLRQALGLADDRRREAQDGLLLRQILETRQTGGRQVQIIVSRRGIDGDPRLPSRLLFACTPEEAARRAARYADCAENTLAAPPLFSAGGPRRLSPCPPVPPKTPVTALTVSAFADYLACPYRFYLRHVLHLKECDDSHEEMQARLFGTLLHDCLAAFARSDAAACSDPAEIKHCLHSHLTRHVRQRFGALPTRTVQMQVRQAERRLEAFAEWQAQSSAAGWAIRPDFSERELTAALDVDGCPVTITGRIDRVDYHAENEQFRVLDYKTGDAPTGPEEKHCSPNPATGTRRWKEMQLPLYRILLAANGAPPDRIAPDALGYLLLSADLTPITFSDRNQRSGGTGLVPVAWTEGDHDSALQCAAQVVRDIRSGRFWPPTDPPPFPPSRTDPGRVDAYHGLCLDSSLDRREWITL